MESSFFKSQTASSRIKANIVAEYFPQYCKILLKRHQGEIRYLDLFAGPGIYEDGNLSTPLLIAKACAADVALKNRVHLMFNDNQYSENLEKNFLKYFPSGTFHYSPRFANKTVGEDARIEKYLEKPKENTPTLLFFDPWGYKGINTLKLANFLSSWGNEIFLFVNIKRIHAAIENNKFDELMQNLFPKNFEKIKKERKYKASVYERLNLIMDHLADEFKSAINGQFYHCAFKFQEEDSKATSHFIIHFTKHSRGYELVKQIYYEFDNIGATLEKNGVYTFDAKKMDANPTIDFGDTNVEALSKELESKYKGKTISAKNLYDEHHPTGKYCGTHYVQTLRHMVEKNKIIANFSDNKVHKVSVLLTENCILKFN